MTRLQLVADYFRAHPNTWIDAHRFVKLGGFAGFTARIRDLRKPPYHWQIDNRVRYEARVWGTETITEYRFVPTETVNKSVDNESLPINHDSLS